MRENSKPSRLLKNPFSCFESLSTNGTFTASSTVYPFALSASKGERGLFQHLTSKVFSISACLLLFIQALGDIRPGGAADGQSADPIVDSLQRNYDATLDFVADFRQETEVKTLNRNLKASGKLSFKRPGKMLWRYDEPKGQFVLADGKYLYFFQPEQNQIIKSPLQNAFRSDIPLSFLLGIGNLKKDFHAALKATDENQFILRLETKGEAGGFSEILVGVSKSSYDLLWISVRDAAANLTTIRFSGMRKGTGVKDSLFTLQIPNGADIVELGQ